MRVLKDGRPFRYYWRHAGDPPKRRIVHGATSRPALRRGPKKVVVWPEIGGVRGKPGEVPPRGIVGDWQRKVYRMVKRSDWQNPVWTDPTGRRWHLRDFARVGGWDRQAQIGGV